MKNFDLLNKLDDSVLLKISSLLEMVHVKKGDSIDLENRDESNVFFLKKGAIIIKNSQTDKAKYIVKQGNLFGKITEGNVVEDNQNNYEYASALEDAILCFFSSEQMQSLLDEHKDLSNSIFKFQNFRINRLETKLSDLINKDSETRIIEFLEDFVRNFGKEKEDYFEAKNFLSHKNIGDLTNTSRQTVSNVLSKLRRDGKIDYSRKSILLYN